MKETALRNAPVPFRPPAPPSALDESERAEAAAGYRWDPQGDAHLTEAPEDGSSGSSATVREEEDTSPIYIEWAAGDPANPFAAFQ